MYKKYLMSAVLAGTALLIQAQEISVFDAGNINSSNPYGLTENEQVLLKNKQRVESVQMNLDDTKENVEGIKTVLEGTNAQISKLENRVADLEVRVGGRLDSQSSSFKDIEQMKKDIQWLKKQISQINSQLKSNTDLKKNDNKKITQKDKAGNSVQINFKDKKTSDIMNEADNFYNQKNYIEAEERYKYLVSNNYKPAKSNYMLGEIAYFQGSYANAIKLYEKSISFNENSEYTPRLLYHTAISFDKIGDTQSANKFYNALKSAYPDSKEAKASPTRK